MPIDKRHRTSCCHRHTNCWGEGNLGPEALERIVSNLERWWWRYHTSTWRSAAWQSQCPWASPDLSSHGASSQTQTPCCSALHRLKQTHNWSGLLFLKKTKMSTCFVLYTSRVYLGWRLCTLDLLTCQVSYHRWFRSLLCSCDSFWVLINCFCWFLAKVPVKLQWLRWPFLASRELVQRVLLLGLLPGHWVKRNTWHNAWQLQCTTLLQAFTTLLQTCTTLHWNFYNFAPSFYHFAPSLYNFAPNIYHFAPLVQLCTKRLPLCTKLLPLCSKLLPLHRMMDEASAHDLKQVAFSKWGFVQQVEENVLGRVTRYKRSLTLLWNTTAVNIQGLVWQFLMHHVYIFILLSLKHQ